MNREEFLSDACGRVICKGDFSAVPEYFSESYKAHADGKEYSGHGFIERYSKQLKRAIPDISLAGLVFFSVTGDMVVWQRTLRGAHKGGMRGIPPSGKMVKWNEMVVSRFENGKIAEEWVVSELAGKLVLKHPSLKSNLDFEF